MTQRWKEDPTLYDCDRYEENFQLKKDLDYQTTYVHEFLNQDPLRDWESIDRCVYLWYWAMKKIDVTNLKNWNVLDCGTKDGQFPEWLVSIVGDVVGTEISPDYVKYAQDKGRPVVFGDVCNMPEDWTEHFDFVFSHHLLGLTPDYWKALEEMYRVTKKGGYMISLNDVPGNPKKHYSFIEDAHIFDEFTILNEVEEIYNGRWNDQYPKEWVYLVQKPKE